MLGFVPERDLVALASRGDRKAFGLLHERYAPTVHAVLLARVPPQDADDLAQEVFVKALEHLASVRDPDALGGWLCALARNLATDYHRGAKRTAALPRDLEGPGDGAAAADALAAIRELPATYAETLAMRLVEGMTGPEIAAATGMTPGSVRVNLHRGMKLLRQRLGEKR
ncbi:MAG: RNA polymerase sigma factor [Planctomycetota bacterium]